MNLKTAFVTRLLPWLCLLPTAEPGRGETIYRSVAAFGADGSGMRDDTAAIRKAIAALGRAGGVVFFPAGTYVISDTLVIDQGGVTLLGEGLGRGEPAGNSAAGSVLRLKSPKTATAIQIRNCPYSGVSNLVVARSGTGGPAQGPAIKMEDTYHGFLKQVVVAAAANGIELLDGISPILEDVALKDLTGNCGIWIHGSGGLGDAHRKIDAGVVARISGSAAGNEGIEWMVIGPNVDGMTVQYARFVGGSRALVLRGGDAARGDTRPKYVHTYAFGSDHALNESVLLEAGNDVFMVDTWLGQTRNASSLVIGPKFTSGAEFVDLRIRGSGGNGMHVMGGQNIYISNPLIGAIGGNRTLVPLGSNLGCGILIDAGVKHLRVTGGCVCPFADAGPRAKQYYGVRYLGTAEQAVTDSVRISGVDTTGNPVEYDPKTLSLDRGP